MSTQDDIDYEDDQEQQQDNLRELRQAAKDGKSAKVEAEGLKRELAFARAGIDTESPKGKMFVKAYDGDLESGAIRASFEELFGAPQPEVPEVPVEDEAATEALRQQTADRRDFSAGTTEAAPPSDPDFIKQGYARMEAAIASGRTREVAFREALSGHIEAANAGQKGATFNGWTDEELDGWS